MARLLTPRADVPFSLDSHMEIIRLTVQFEEKATSGPTVSYLDCFRGANLRRTEIASLAWLTPAFCGAPFMGYGIQYMIQAGLKPNNGFALSLGQTGISLAGCLIAWYIMTVAGRRAMYLIGLAALTVILFTIGCLGLAPSSNSGASWAVGGLILLIVFVFQLTVSGTMRMCKRILSLFGNALTLSSSLSRSAPLATRLSPKPRLRSCASRR